MRVYSQKGYTLWDLIFSIAIVGILVSIAIPHFMRTFQASQAMTCYLYRQNIQTAADIYIREHHLRPGDDLPTISELVAENLLPEEDHCPAGGIYVWADPIYHGPSEPFLISCSLHFFVPKVGGEYLK